MYKVRIDKFEGPFDLLIYLLENARMDIYDIKVAEITEQYIGYLKEMEELIASVKAKGDTVGGIITCVIKGCPAGLGEPEFEKLHAQLGAAMLSINAVKGFEYGEGFDCVNTFGSEQNDVFVNDDRHIKARTNHSGGIQGGISNGEDIYMRIAFKPVATLLMEQETIDLDGNPTTLKARGRHDPCVLPRAVPIVEAMAAMVVFDSYLKNKSAIINSR